MSLCPQQQLEPSPAESKDSYESVEGRRVKPGDYKAPDHSPPSSDPGSVSELDRPTKPPGESVDPLTKPPGESVDKLTKPPGESVDPSTKPPGESVDPSTKPPESAMVTITKYLNRNSRDYRYVVRMLALEKKMLKEDSDFGKGTRNGPSMVWQPLPSLLDHKKLMNSAAAEGDSSDSSQQLEVDLATMKTPRLDQAQARSSPVHSSEDLLAAPVGSINRLTEESQGVPEIRLVAPSLERGLDSGSGVLVDESDSDSQHELSAADQPPVVQLCIAIYYSLMSHSELICYFMVFLHQIKSATILSLPLPLMVFLWGTLTVPRPTKTFWVTLIAYTEPFFPPRIIGIEQKPNYATYDLALLLIIFFHRVMLKSMGLWKSSYEDPIRFPKKEEMFALDSSGSDEQQTKAGEEFSDLQPSKLCLRRGSAGSKSSSVRQVVTQGGRRLSAIRSVEDLEGETSTDLPTTQLVVVETERESALVHFPAIIKLATVRYFDSIRKFFENLMVPSSRVTADVYTYMFLCDFFNFLVVVVGIESFGTQQGDGGVTAYLEENKVPIPFLLMLILQFALIVIDRALYLRKHILGKIVFQFLLVVGIHIWMFFIHARDNRERGNSLGDNREVTESWGSRDNREDNRVSGITESYNAALPPQMWYMVKSFYLLLSAYQIRCGYPTRILGNVLCKRYNILNYVLFKGYLLVPFLFELRTIMDWVWTNTTMTLMDWLKMEDIFNNIFQHKCARRMESEYPQPRGERKNPTVKYLMGGGALVVIIGILWFPLVLFALGNTVGKPNLPYDVTLSLRIGPYQPVYTMSAQNNSIYRRRDKGGWGKTLESPARACKGCSEIPTGMVSSGRYSGMALLPLARTFGVTHWVLGGLVELGEWCGAGEGVQSSGVSALAGSKARERERELVWGDWPLRGLSDQQWTKMANAYKSDRVAQTFLSGYDSEDVGVVALGGNSTSVWGISPPDMDRLILEVASANPIVFKLAWKVSRASNNPEVSGVTEETREWVMEAVDSAGNRNPQREVLANMLGRVNSSTTKAIIVQDVLPKFVKVTNRNTVPAVKQLMGEDGE
uniref:Piezo non-specific cation channel R-Ras-binding domain-containing protein n=1 Tax=Timema cristinae TaxID=61476 RepID=A0A7R9CQG1_TIMCR|nr:unnamed protein product [Timema cristinae]